MILQALKDHYEDLIKANRISGPGWGEGDISYALYINESGKLEHLASLKCASTTDSNKMLPRRMTVPAAVKRTSGIKPNFLWDNSKYIFGIDYKEHNDRAKLCFNACKQLHEELLKDVDIPAARAVINFFKNWDPDSAPNHPEILDNIEGISSESNFIFCFNHVFLTEYPEIKEVWEKRFFQTGDGPEMTCLITGQKSKIENIHPAIKGIRNSQSSGAALVTFNSPAFCSYGKEQNFNAPISRYAAFAYTSALNILSNKAKYVGDTALISWVKGLEEEYTSFLNFSLLESPSDENLTEEDLNSMLLKLAKGEVVRYKNASLNPKRNFFILGIAPNAARLSIRYFVTNTFGEIINNINLHNERVKILNNQSPKTPKISNIVYATLNSNSKTKESEKKKLSEMYGELLRSVLTNTRYPTTLINSVTLRIKAEHKISSTRAALIKAYYLKNVNKDVPTEVLEVSLNKETQDIPYNLGRLFSILEGIQSAANNNLNSTIKDKYFNSASATPGLIFPLLIKLAQSHLRKLNEGLAISLNQKLTAIMSKFPEKFPDRLNLAQQGGFQLGYYHQNEERFQKKAKEVK